MKSKYLLLVLLCALPGLLTSKARAIDPDLGHFLFSKQQQIHDLSEGLTNKVAGG